MVKRKLKVMKLTLHYIHLKHNTSKVSYINTSQFSALQGSINRVLKLSHDKALPLLKATSWSKEWLLPHAHAFSKTSQLQTTAEYWQTHLISTRVQVVSYKTGSYFDHNEFGQYSLQVRSLRLELRTSGCLPKKSKYGFFLIHHLLFHTELESQKSVFLIIIFYSGIKIASHARNGYDF